MLHRWHLACSVSHSLVGPPHPATPDLWLPCFRSVSGRRSRRTSRRGRLRSNSSGSSRRSSAGASSNCSSSSSQQIHAGRPGRQELPCDTVMHGRC
jgi:hypothetical protein